MRLPPLQLMSDTHFFVSGDVTIHPTAAIAPGVLLEADPDSQLIIQAGVCIGMGTTLHAQQGILEIDTGASLGSGVLMVGSGKIGANACIGSMATLFNASVEPEQIIAAGTLVGDTSRQWADLPTVTASVEISASVTIAASSSPSPEPASSPQPKVYGQESFKQLMTSLFPHRSTGG
jgi:carbon dioxide concentrating mechanism protein CcmN